MAQTLTEIVNRTYRTWGAELSPPIIFQTEQESRDSVLGDEYAGFDMGGHNLMMNKEKIDKNLGMDFFPVILSHEVGHYSLAPFDLENMIYLVHEAKKVFGDVKTSKHIENLFTDTIVNSYIFKNDTHNKDKIVKLYNKMCPPNQNSPDAWKVYLRTYEKLWNLKPDTLVKGCSKDVDDAAVKISKILAPNHLGNVFDQPEWRTKIRKYAEVMKPFIDAEKQDSCQKGQGKGGQGQNQGNQSQGQGNQSQGNSGQQNPAQNSQGQGQNQGSQSNGQNSQQQGNSGQHPGQNQGSQSYTPGNQAGGNQGQQNPAQAGQGQGNRQKELGAGIIINKHDPKGAKQDEKTFGRVAEQIGKDEAKAIYAGLGLGSPSNLEDALIDSLAELYTIVLPRAKSFRTGKKFIGYQKVSASKFNKADLVYSISSGGRLIPGYNTFAQRFKESNNLAGEGMKTPDLNIALDTSGSMQGAAYYSVLASKIAANSTLKAGGAVAVYNFSCRCIGHEKGFMRDKKKVYRLIERQQNGGTTFPTKELVDNILKNKENPQYLMVITDTAWSNVSDAVKALQQVDQCLVGGAFFLVNTVVPLHSDLNRFNYEIIPVSDSSLTGETRLRMRKVLNHGN